MPSAEVEQALSGAQRQTLLRVARESIAKGLAVGKPFNPGLQGYSGRLRAPGASFVTLEKNGRLRGCIGALEPYQPLVQDVATHAFDAAFRDPRFPALEPGELADLEIALSVLSAPQPVTATDEDALLDLLRPGVDGLVLVEGRRRATFLPAVWEKLPDKRVFLNQLRLKAGLPKDHWSETLRFSRYSTESFHE